MSGPLDLPRMLAGALGDIRRIADGMAVLPDLLAALDKIDERVEAMAAEVARMRRGVDGVNEAVEPLAEEIGATRAGIDAIGPRLDELHRTLRPLRRLASRTRGRREPAA